VVAILSPHFRRERQPILWLWVHIAAQPLDIARCQARNPWGSVGTHFLNSAMSMLFLFSAITPTNTFTLEWADNGALWFLNVYDLRSLTHRSRSLWGLGSKHVLCLFGCNSNKYIQFGRSWKCSPVIFECVKLQIVHTPVMLILGWGNTFTVCVFGYHTDQYTHFGRTRQWSHLVVECVRLWIVDAPWTLIFGMEQRACHLPFRRSRWPIHSLWQDETMQLFDCW